jgi:hypothetical protein
MKGKRLEVNPAGSGARAITSAAGSRRRTPVGQAVSLSAPHLQWGVPSVPDWSSAAPVGCAVLRQAPTLRFALDRLVAWTAFGKAAEVRVNVAPHSKMGWATFARTPLRFDFGAGVARFALVSWRMARVTFVAPSA